MPVSRGIVDRFVAGRADRGRGARHPRARSSDGLLVTIDHLGEDTLDLAQAEATRGRLPRAARRRCRARLISTGAEVSVKLSALGQALPGDGEKIALEHAREICSAAARRRARR